MRMAEGRSYCAAVRAGELGPAHVEYHDARYGRPPRDDAELLKWLVIELNQAGLSWDLVLKREPTFIEAYRGFDVDTVAAFDQADIERLLNDRGVIRHRGKIEAAIANARTVQSLQENHGSFEGWLDAHHPLELDAWVKLFRQTFKFTGPEITNEFLMCVGYLPGAHDPDCPKYSEVLAEGPAWARSRQEP
jgi:DNA-3-methyladenine glycosylase I